MTLPASLRFLVVLVALSLSLARATAPGPCVPSARQLAWATNEFEVFIHFGVNTLSGEEWGGGREDPARFNPAALDAGQWVRAIRGAGATGLVLVAKHHDGFCLWPSR